MIDFNQIIDYLFQGPINKDESKLSDIALAGMESVRILEQGKQGNS